MQTPYWSSECGSVLIYCADCTDILPQLKCDAVVTDPPYGLGFQYNSHDDNRSDWFNLMDRVVPILKERSRFTVMPCCGIDRMGWWYAQHAPEWIIIWYKGSTGHRSAIGFNDYEAHLCWGRPKVAMHDYFQTRCGFEETHTDHSCPKPVEWANWLVTRAAQPSELVIDPFMGSGTVALSCIRNNRRFIGIEKDRKYCDQAVGRIKLERIMSPGKAPARTRLD